jgi:hypothetical protein
MEEWGIAATFIFPNVPIFHHSNIPMFDEIVKIRHSRVDGNPDHTKPLKGLDSLFHENDGKTNLRTFYDFIRVGVLRKKRGLEKGRSKSIL